MHTRTRVLIGLVAMLGCIAMSVSAATARVRPASKMYQCQHPTVTGVEAYNLHNVSVQTACSVSMALYRYATTGHVVVSCSASEHPTLRLHHFEGWTASLPRQGFTFTRGSASFQITGTDFPLLLSGR